MLIRMPTNRELQTLLPDKQARLSQERVGLQIMPIRETRYAFVDWIIPDNQFGLQKLRGYDGSPTRIQRVGKRRYRYEPGVYGEFFEIDEQEISIRAGDTEDESAIIDLDGEITNLQDVLVERELDRIEMMVWLLLTTGTFSVAQSRADGTVLVVYTDTFAIQTVTATTPWATRNTATPIANFLALAILGRGKGVSFGPKATAYMNLTTWTNLMLNANAADLGGRKVLGGDTVNALKDVNQILLGYGLPQISIYDEGYYDDSNTWQIYIPDAKVVVVGSRARTAKIGEYIKTRNIYAKGAKGSYTLVKNFFDNRREEVRIGKGVEVHQGHNGGPALYYPNAVVVMNV